MGLGLYQGLAMGKGLHLAQGLGYVLVPIEEGEM